MATRFPAVAAPLLGVAGTWGTTEVELFRRFDELHQLIYKRGDVRPTNAAVEEVAKLIFLRFWSLKNPSAKVRKGLSATELFETQAPDGSLVDDFKLAFSVALASDDLVATSPQGVHESIWPADEPFRLRDPGVLAAAATLISDIIQCGVSSVADPMGIAFDALLSGRYDHSGGLGTYLTPSSVARMMAEIAVELLDIARVDGEYPGYGDPYCGTGRFLVATTEVLRELGTPIARTLLRARAFGADQSTSAVAKARINMLLYGEERPLVWTVRDSVTNIDLAALHEQIPLILTNPPFGDGKYDSASGIDQTARAIPRFLGKERIDPAMAGLVKCLRLLKPGGILGIVLPDGLTESRAFEELVGNTSGDLRGQISIVASVSLPTATFSLSGTVAKTSAIFIRRGSPSHRVAIARADHVGYVRQAGKATRDPEGSDLPAISSAIRQGFTKPRRSVLSIESERPLVATAKPGILQSYSPSRFDPNAMEARRSLVADGGMVMRELLAAKKARRIRTARSTRYFVSVLHIDDLGNIDWQEAASHRPVTPGIAAAEGDILVSLLNPAKLRAGVIPSEIGGVQVSAEFGVFRARCNPYALLGILYAEQVRKQLKPLGRGTSSSRRRIDVEDVLSLAIPRLSDEELAKLGDRVESAIELVASGRKALYTEYFNL